MCGSTNMAELIKSISNDSRRQLNEQVEEYYKDQSITTDVNGCHIWQLNLSSNTRRNSSRYGLINIKIEDKVNKTTCWRRLGAHIVVYFLRTSQVPLKGVTDISHLCHNSLCVNFDHLNREPHSINIQRYTSQCKTTKICLGHTDEKSGDVFPKCIIN